MSSQAPYHTTKSSVMEAMQSVATSLERNSALALCLDFEWDSHASEKPMQLLQVATEDGCIHVFDAKHVPEFPALFNRLFLQSSSMVKVLHDARADTLMLRSNLSEGFAFAPLYDTQVAHAVLTGHPERSLAQVLKHWLGIDIKKRTKRVNDFLRTPGKWSERPLPQYIIDYAAEDVVHLPRLYSTQMEEATSRGLCHEILVRSELRAKGRNASLAAQKETSRAFKTHLGLPDGMDKEILRGMFTDWKASELARGEYRHGTFNDILRVFMYAGVARTKGSVVAFATPGARKFEKSLLLAATARVESSRAQIEADKGGVVVTSACFPESTRPNETAECLLEVRNQGAESVTLRDVKLLRGTTGFSQKLAVPLPAELPPGAMVTLRLQCTPRVVGMCYDILSLTFDGGAGGGGSFIIGRFLKLSCGDMDLLHDLAPTSPYERRRRKRAPPVDKTTLYDAPPKEGDGDTTQKFEPLQPYHIPKWLRSKLDGRLVEGLEELAERMTTAPPKEALKRYAEYYQRLLWMEEHQLHADLAGFDLVDELATELAPRGRLLAVHVRGLAEKRPSVLKGDILRVNRLNDQRQVWQGRAEEIEMEDVLLHLDQRFVSRYIRGEKVEVRFVMNRTPLRIFHQGLAAAKALGAYVLFPPARLAEVALQPPRCEGLELRFFNRAVAANAAQREAVRRVLDGEAREVPYILFGPPGTGKTTTVVEIISQCRRLPRHRDGRGFRTLVCAPTNTAADLLCSRIGCNDRTQILRHMAYSRAKSTVPEEVLKVSNWSEAHHAFVQPPLEEIMSKTVNVMTLSTAGKLTNMGVPRGHFDMIVIDEAGQALEPEAAAPVCTLLGGDGQLVLAGDPKQLGPVIHSTQASAHGLAKSLLERLMERPLYQRDPGSNCYEQLVLTKLVQNFRSHEALLRVPNRLFYEDELQCCADEALRNYCCGPECADLLPAPGVPLVFHGIVGKDQREGNSPSWFNAHECTVVLDYIRALQRVRGRPVAFKDIGVITPYNKQAQKITRLLKGADLPCGADGIKVGSTELFQGQERKVIIISTVRSSADEIGFDVKHNLGFLQNPKRFNVATTRACSLMVIIGNPDILVTDAHWSQLLRECIRLGAYQGVKPPTTASTKSSGSGGDGQHDQHSSNEDRHADQLAEDLEQLVLSASERVQQEGSEMPTWE
ncbi:hypothetical protein CYMTET_24188 [Cymbomonas tetramitiformis]|uniref:RNA helicase n=1 Tax=Cymbomonas tetramitiformis TaxID=36881 RepID=A0AAE0L0A9_9CHLO|nr:hypothetical protein CYMTET_24188 [Cymbomonas tetramitiformis]